MSLRISRAVWEHSRAKGRARLVLLALADHADDDGRAWPSVARLARYTLMDVRNVHRALARLIEEGEIVPDGKAKRGVVVYRLTPNGSQPEPLAKSPEVEPIDPWRNRQMAKSSYGETARGTSGETARGTSGETARQTVIEQSLERSESSSTGEQAAVDLWNELAGELDLRPVQRLTTSRRSALAARLAECGGLDGWRGALDAIRATPFLRGENDRNWRASFDWLVDGDQLRENLGEEL